MRYVSKMQLERKNVWLRSVQLRKDRDRIEIAQQLQQAILEAVKADLVKEGGVLPSINQLSDYFDVSRWTVERAFKELRKKGYIVSVPRKGYFITRPGGQTAFDREILILMNNQDELNNLVYRSFRNMLPEQVQINCLVYNNNRRLFTRLIEKGRRNDVELVILPHVVADMELLIQKINNLPRSQVIRLMDFLDSLTKENELLSF